MDHRRTLSIVRARSVWAAGRSIEPGDPVDLYLRGRGLPSPSPRDPWFAELRCAELRHPSGHVGPVMLAAVRNLQNEIVGVSRLWLTDDGSKASVEPARMFVGSVKGAAFKSSGDSRRGRVIQLCEGVEDCLAALLVPLPGWPWATLSASGLESVELPGGRDVIIHADRDPVGIRAARRAAKRFIAEGRHVDVRLPAAGEKDLGELAQEGIQR